MYIESAKHYTDNSKWLAKLFLKFCRENKFQFLMFESRLNRKGIFDWLVNHPLAIINTVSFFDHPFIPNPYEIFYRNFMWKYFLLYNQDLIPSYFKIYIGPEKLVKELKRQGANKDKTLLLLLYKVRIMFGDF